MEVFLLNQIVKTNDPIIKITKCYKSRLSYRLIKDRADRLDKKFSFEKISDEEFHK